MDKTELTNLFIAICSLFPVLCFSQDGAELITIDQTDSQYVIKLDETGMFQRGAEAIVKEHHCVIFLGDLIIMDYKDKIIGIHKFTKEDWEQHEKEVLEEDLELFRKESERLREIKNNKLK